MFLRDSLKDIPHMVRDISYPAPLPMALVPLHAYVTDTGHSIMAVPEAFVKDALRDGCKWYEIPMPVRYVLETGWKPIPGTDAVSVPVPYDENMGALIPDGYEEY